MKLKNFKIHYLPICDYNTRQLLNNIGLLIIRRKKNTAKYMLD